MPGNYRIFSKYRLLARLGSGGMAEVFLAVTGTPGGFNKLQVLKVLRSDLPEQERLDFARMFHDEARLAARLSHPHIVQSHEVGSEEGHDFIAMEFLEGQPLSHVQERSWAGGEEFTLEMQLQVLCCVLDGLEYAHTLRDYDGRLLHIVHRDVSPQNVFITYAGHTKLVDFGIAKTLESNKTRAGVVKGKVPYMSPEQVLGGAIDHRADLFSVGVMLWEAVARRHMHGDTSVYEILRSLVQGELPSLKEAAPDVPPELERIVTRALARQPEQRYPDANAFREDLLAFLETRRKVTPREIGERVSSMFAQERREINEVIRRAMTEANDERFESGQVNAVHLLPTLSFLASKATTGPTTSPVTTPTTPPHLVPPPELAAMTTRPTPDPATSSSNASNANSSAPPVNVSSAAPVNDSRRWIPLASLAALGLLFFALSTLRPTAKELPSAAAPVASAATAPLAAETPAAASSVRVRIHAIPENAKLLLDNAPLAGNPVDAERPRDDALHALVVSAPGHDSRTLQLRLNRDVDLEVRLAQAEQPEGARGAVPPQKSPHAAKVSPRAGSPAQKRSDDELYKDLPARKAGAATAPPLDTSESPW